MSLKDMSDGPWNPRVFGNSNVVHPDYSGDGGPRACVRTYGRDLEEEPIVGVVVPARGRSMPYTEVSEAARLYHKTRALHTVVTDVVVIRGRHNGEDGYWGGDVLLIKRGHEPFSGCYALPGGFVEAGERTIHAAERELEEETGLRAARGGTRLVGVFDAPDRDPRGPNIGVTYLVTDFDGEARGGDDAAEAAWFPLDRLPPLAFDHADIVLAAVAFYDNEGR